MSSFTTSTYIHTFEINGALVPLPRTVTKEVAEATSKMILDVARNGIGEKTPAKGMLVIAGDGGKFSDLGKVPKRNKFQGQDVNILNMDSEDKTFVYECFIADGAMIIDGRTGRIIANNYRVGEVAHGDDGGGLKHKAGSAIAQSGACLAIKCSEDHCVVDGQGKGELKVFPAQKSPVDVSIVVISDLEGENAELRRQLEALKLQQSQSNTTKTKSSVAASMAQKFYVTHHKDFGTVWGDVYGSYPEADARFNELNGRNLAAALWDHKFKELRYYGCREGRPNEMQAFAESHLSYQRAGYNSVDKWQM